MNHVDLKYKQDIAVSTIVLFINLHASKLSGILRLTWTAAIILIIVLLHMLIAAEFSSLILDSEAPILSHVWMLERIVFQLAFSQQNPTLCCNSLRH